MHALEYNYSESKDGGTQRRFDVALHKTARRTESLPNQDSEDTQQQFSRARPHSIKSLYSLSTHDITHVRICTRPSPDTVLQVTESWAGA